VRVSLTPGRKRIVCFQGAGLPQRNFVISLESRHRLDAEGAVHRLPRLIATASLCILRMPSHLQRCRKRWCARFVARGGRLRPPL
jgi:hypothetical protein